MRLIKAIIIFFFSICFLINCEKQDNEAPIVTILNLEENQTILETVIISVEATDNEAVEKVELWLDNQYSGISDITEPYELEWNTIGYENKIYSVTIRGYDINNNMSETDPINIVVDNKAPTIIVSNLEINQTVNETVIISVEATDNEAVEKVELWLDNQYSGISDITEPYELEWNTVGYENKIYSVTIRGYDINTNMSETDPINIIVDNSEELEIPTTITSTIIVNNESELREAIQIDHTYIIINNDISLTYSSNYRLGNGVIINGNGDEYGNGGKVIYANGTLPSGAFIEMGNDSEIWGIRLIGNNSTNSKGISAVNKDNIKIMNCEITGFSNYGINFGGNTSLTYKKGFIGSSFIHDNQQSPYGYGIVINKNSEVTINKNKFINNRHHVASRDQKDSNEQDYSGVRYEASYNLILENTEDEEAHFDVHGNDSYGSCLNIGFQWDNGQAGDWIKIHHNIFLGKNEIHILIRGTPVSTISDGGGYQIYGNNFGPDMNEVITCKNLVSSEIGVAILFTDQNVVIGDNFNYYVSIYDNY